MSTRGDDDSRPSRPLISQRPTARDVPIAKYQEPSSAPRGLRGQSLLPGQGAPERIVPEDIELAVLREADTLDGPHVARVAARRFPEPASSPPPTPVSVEVPRVRSVPPSLEPYVTTPTTPSARSVQSGTLMSVGSIDPRAPTELSLPSPRALSQSERAAYLGPEAVVDRTPVSALPHSEPAPHSSPRSVPAGSGPPASSARRSPRADSPPPHARHFGRAPQSYSPVSLTPAPRTPGAVSQPPVSDAAPRYEIHSQLDAVPHEFGEDNFDLRSVSTQREPLASRKSAESSDWATVHEPVSTRRDSSAPSERGVRHNPSSSSAITILVDPGRQSLAPMRDSLPSAPQAAPQRTSVPLSWVLGAAAFALLLALLVAWVVRAPAAPEAARPSADHAQTSHEAALATAQPVLQAALPVTNVAPDTRGAPAAVVSGPPIVNPVLRAPAAVSAPHLVEMPLASAATARPLPAASARAADSRVPAVASAEPSLKARQSIY